MVPGLIAGQYRPEQLQIDVRRLAEQAGIQVVIGKVVGIDPHKRRVLLENQTSIPYHLAAFDIGSTVAGLDSPGVREHALATRPIGVFAERVGSIIVQARQGVCLIASIDSPLTEIPAAQTLKELGQVPRQTVFAEDFEDLRRIVRPSST